MREDTWELKLPFVINKNQGFKEKYSESQAVSQSQAACLFHCESDSCSLVTKCLVHTLLVLFLLHLQSSGFLLLFQKSQLALLVFVVDGCVFELLDSLCVFYCLFLPAVLKHLLVRNSCFFLCSEKQKKGQKMQVRRQ